LEAGRQAGGKEDRTGIGTDEFIGGDDSDSGHVIVHMSCRAVEGDIPEAMSN